MEEIQNPLPSPLSDESPLPQPLHSELLTIFENYITPIYKKHHKYIKIIKIRIKSTKKDTQIIFEHCNFKPVTFNTEELLNLCTPILINTFKLYKQYEPKKSTCRICYNITKKKIIIATPQGNTILKNT